MRNFLSVSLLYFVFVILFTYPSVHHLTDKVIGDGGDNYQFLAFQVLANKQFKIAQLPFGWTNYWRYPVGFDFSNGYDSSLFLILGIVIGQISNDPVLIYNLSVLALLFLDALLSYFLFYEITGSFLFGFAGGLIYGFSFYNLARMGGHPNLLLTGVFPFFLYALMVVRRNLGDIKSITILTLAVLLLHLSSLQHVLLLAGFMIFFLPLLFVFYKDIFLDFLNFFWYKRIPLIPVFIINLLVFLFFNYSKLEATINKTLVLPGAEIVSPQFINFLLPNKYLKLVIGTLGNPAPEWIENAIFLGIVEIVIFVLFLASKITSVKFRLFIGSVFLINLIFALGDGQNPSLPLPYPLIFPFMPFRGIIEAGRFYIFLNLALVIGLVLYLPNIFKRLGSWVFVLILFLIIYERLPQNFYLSSTQKDEEFIDYVKNSDTGGVLDLPLYPEWWNGNLYDMYSVYYGKPIVNGYIHWSGLTPEAKFFTDKLHRFECNLDPEFFPHQFTEDEILGEIEENKKILPEFLGYNIRTFVDHKDLSRHPKECGDAIQRIHILFEQSDLNFNKIFEDENKIVYTLNY